MADPLGTVGNGHRPSGSILLADPKRQPQSTDQPQTSLFHAGVQDRLLAVALTAAGSIFLKLAMQYQDALMSLAVWSLASWVLALMWMIIESVSCRLRPGTVWRKVIRLAWQPSVFGIAGCMLVMQWLTIAVFQAMHVGYALALFQLGSLVSVYLGHRLFGETDYLRRLLAASIMFIGAAVIVLAG